MQLIVAESARGPPTFVELATQPSSPPLPPPPPPLAEQEAYDVQDSDVELPPPPAPPELQIEAQRDVSSRRSSSSSSSPSSARYEPSVEGWLRGSQDSSSGLSSGLRSPRPPPTPDSISSLASSSNHSSAYFSNVSSSNGSSKPIDMRCASEPLTAVTVHKPNRPSSLATTKPQPKLDSNGNTRLVSPQGCKGWREAAPLTGLQIAIAPSDQLNDSHVSSDLSWAQDEITCLRAELASAHRELDENENFGKSILLKLKTANLNFHEFDKITVHYEEVDKVMKLIMSLGQRLRTIERDLAQKSSEVLKHKNAHNESSNLVKTTKIILETAPLITLPDNLDNQPEIQLLISKRSKLITQLDEAEQLKQLIDKRTVTLSGKLQQFCTNHYCASCVGDFEEFIARKQRLISEVALITERIQLCEILE